MKPTQVYRVRDRVRTLIPVGPKLPKGSMGVVQAVDESMYPASYKGPDGKDVVRTAQAYTISVVFPTLGNADSFYRDIEDLDPKSVPHMNAVAFRPDELEKIDSLAIESQKDEDHA